MPGGGAGRGGREGGEGGAADDFARASCLAKQDTCRAKYYTLKVCNDSKQAIYTFPSGVMAH